MATPVPYEGAPTINPQMEPIRPVGISTPPDAFGVNIAEATAHLGQVVEGAGKELFDRAYAMQDLQVHADVNARLADMQNKQLQRGVEFGALEGKHAVDAYPQFQSDLEAIRQAGGRGLSPIGQSYYDTESRQSTFRQNFQGAGHAREEQKRYIIGAADAGIESATKAMEADPNNPATIEASIKSIKDKVALKFDGIGGMSPVEVQQKQADAVNVALNRQIRALAPGHPIEAQKMFDQALRDGDIYGSDVTNLSWYIQNQRDTVGARTTAAQVMGEDGTTQNSGSLAGTRAATNSLPKGGIGGVPSQVLSKARTIAMMSRDPAAVEAFMQAQGFPQHAGEWCGDFVAAVVRSVGGTPPAGAPMASAWRNYGSLREGPPQPGDVAIWMQRDRNGTLGRHVTIVDSVNPDGTFVGLGGNQSGGQLTRSTFKTAEFEFRTGQVPPRTLEQLTDQGAKIAEQQFPGDATYKERVVDNIIAQYNKRKAIREDTDFNNDQTLSNALFNGVGPKKVIPTTLEELRLDPDASQALDAVQANHPSMMRKYIDILAKNAKGDVAMTAEREQQWQTLYGEYIHDPEKFMADTQDQSKLDLPFAQINQILRMQGEVFKKESANPQMGHALSVAAPMLQHLGITKADNPDKLNLFTGVLHDVMEQYQRANGKPMGDEEIKNAAQRLLNPVTNPGFFGKIFGKSTPWFESIDMVPPEIADSMRQDYESRGITADDPTILRDYLADQYQELVKPKPKPGSNSGPQRYPQTAPNVKTFQ